MATKPFDPESCERRGTHRRMHSHGFELDEIGCLHEPVPVRVRTFGRALRMLLQIDRNSASRAARNVSSPSRDRGPGPAARLQRLQALAPRGSGDRAQVVRMSQDLRLDLSEKSRDHNRVPGGVFMIERRSAHRRELALGAAQSSDRQLTQVRRLTRARLAKLAGRERRPGIDQRRARRPPASQAARSRCLRGRPRSTPTRSRAARRVARIERADRCQQVAVGVVASTLTK